VALPAVFGPKLHGCLILTRLKLDAFGRQPSAVLLESQPVRKLALTLLAEPADPERELATYELAYREAFPRRVLGVLGLKPAAGGSGGRADEGAVRLDGTNPRDLAAGFL